MSNKTELKENILALGIPLFLFCAFFLVFGNVSKSAVYIALTGGVLFSSWLLFFKISWFYLLLIALIPFSQDIFVGEFAKANLPSELLLVTFVPFAFLFIRDYSKGFVALLKHPITVLIVIDIIVGLVSTFQSDHIAVGLKRTLVQVLFFTGFFVPLFLFKNVKSKYNVWIAYCIGLIPVMYFTIKTHYNHDFNPKIVFSVCQPYFNDHTVYGACLEFILPFLLILTFKKQLFKKNKAIKIGLILLLFFVIVSELLALSRAAILSLVVALLFFFVLKLKVKFVYFISGVLILSMIALAFSDNIYKQMEASENVSNDGQVTNHLSSVTNLNNDASNLERINRWVCAIRMFNERPILGFGPGTYQFEYNRFQSAEYKTYISTNAGDKGNAHSEYLGALSEKGVFGGVVFLLIVLVSLSTGMQNHYNLPDGLLKSLNLAMLLGLVTFFFHAFFNSFLDQIKIGFLVYSALAGIVAINLKLKNESN